MTDTPTTIEYINNEPAFNRTDWINVTAEFLLKSRQADSIEDLLDYFANHYPRKPLTSSEVVIIRQLFQNHGSSTDREEAEL